MNIRGSQTIDAPRRSVFAAILDPEMLLGVIPGCREIEKTGDDEYRGLIVLRVPGVAGTYRTVVRVIDADEPSYGRLEGEITGALGSITGRASFRLADADGSTTIDYDGQGEIGGPLARLDSRFAEGLAGSLISQGLGNLEARLRRDPSTAVGSDGGRASEETAG